MVKEWRSHPGWLYLGLALLAAIAAMVAMAQFVTGQEAPGWAMQGLLATLVPGVDGAGLGVWIGTVTLLVFAQASAKQIGWRRAGVPVLGALLLGAACRWAISGAGQSSRRVLCALVALAILTNPAISSKDCSRALLRTRSPRTSGATLLAAVSAACASRPGHCALRGSLARATACPTPPNSSQAALAPRPVAGSRPAGVARPARP